MSHAHAKCAHVGQNFIPVPKAIQVTTTNRSGHISSRDAVVVVTGPGVTLRLPDCPANGEEHKIVAPDDDVLVRANADIRGESSGVFTVSAGTSVTFTFAKTTDCGCHAKGVWVPAAGDDDLQFVNQLAWEINYTTGDDEASGKPGSPLKRFSELARRLPFIKYAPTSIDGSKTFGPYTISMTDPAGVPANDDSFQWTPQLVSVGTVATDPVDGSTDPIAIVTGLKTYTAGSDGVLTTYTNAGGNAQASITRAAGAFAVGDIIEWQNGPLAGRHIEIDRISGGGLVGGINPNLLPAIVAGALTWAFKVITFAPFGPQLTTLGFAPYAIQWKNFRFNAAAGAAANTPGGYEHLGGFVLRFVDCDFRTFVSPGLGTTVGYSRCLLNFPLITSLTMARGTTQISECTLINAVADPMGEARLESSKNEYQAGCIRLGSRGSRVSGEAQGAFLSVGPGDRFFDYPAVIPANKDLDANATGDAGAGIIICRGGNGIIRTDDGTGTPSVVSNTAAANTAGLNIADRGAVEIVGPTPTGLTSTAAGGQDIVIDGSGALGAAPSSAIPYINPANGMPVAGLPLTSWTVWAAAFGTPGYDRNAMNLANGTSIYDEIP